MNVQNFLNPVEFKFNIKRLPSTKFYVQGATIPDISSGVTEQFTPFKTIYRPGDKLTFGDLVLTVAVDENLESYVETWNWLNGLTKPEKFDQYANLLSGDGLYSDATLTLVTNAKNPNIEVTFYDMFPISVGQITLNTTSTTVEAPTVDLTFKFSSYKINVV
jgi:hypothetical protein